MIYIKIDIEDELYPIQLKQIKNPPKQLYCKGNIDLLKNLGFAIIGSRNCSTYGKEATLQFAKELSQYQINIVSGMAIGIDSYAHIGTIENGGNTIAVLPSGLENIYPAENKKLFDNIIDKNGLIITEYESYFEANYKSFLERNRIVSGLSIGILVVEGAYRSGTSVTAKITKKSNKKIFCIPSSLNNPKGYMPNQLIREGGILVTCVEDIIREYPELYILKNTKNNITKVKPQYKKIYEIIGDEPIYINEIINKSGMNLEDIHYKLMMLELDGYIKSLPGNNFKRIK